MCSVGNKGVVILFFVMTVSISHVNKNCCIIAVFVGCVNWLDILRSNCVHWPCDGYVSV